VFPPRTCLYVQKPSGREGHGVWAFASDARPRWIPESSQAWTLFLRTDDCRVKGNHLASEYSVLAQMVQLSGAGNSWGNSGQNRVVYSPVQMWLVTSRIPMKTIGLGKLDGTSRSGGFGRARYAWAGWRVAVGFLARGGAELCWPCCAVGSVGDCLEARRASDQRDPSHNDLYRVEQCSSQSSSYDARGQVSFSGFKLVVTRACTGRSAVSRPCSRLLACYATQGYRRRRIVLVFGICTLATQSAKCFMTN
jgi:hypothetical protein